MISASKVGLAMACPYVLSQTMPESEGGEAAAIGDEVHRWLTDKINGNPTKEFSEAAEPFREAAENAFATFYQSTDTDSELAYALHTDTCESTCIGMDIARAYPDSDGHVIHGSADAVTVGPAMLIVDDWKTGREADIELHEPQLMTLGAMVGLATPIPWKRMVLRVLHLRHHGSIDVSEKVVDRFDLIEWVGLLHDLLTGPMETPVPGLHCSADYCPLIPACPYHVTLAGEITALSSETAKDLVSLGSGFGHSLSVPTPEQITSAKHAAWLYHRMKAGEQFLEALKKTLQAWSDVNGPFPIGRGKQYGPTVEHHGAIRLDVSQIAHLTGLSEEEVWGCATKPKLVKGNLEDLIKKRAPKGKATVAWKSTLNELRKADLLAEREVKVHEVHSDGTKSRKAK